MSYLDTIIQHKRQEVALRASLYPEKLLQQSLFFSTGTVSLAHYLERKDKTGIISEFKRASPSAGMINTEAPVAETTVAYMQAGSSALSILTDEKYFNGSLRDLQKAREMNYCPILQKDFIISPYQLIEAKAYGADAVLLIAAVNTKQQLKDLHSQAYDLGLEVVTEIHDAKELEKVPAKASLIGVNARDLTTFKVSIEQQLAIIKEVPSNCLAIAESGIRKPEDIIALETAGYKGFLMGTLFMEESQPGKACKRFSKKLKDIRKEINYEATQ